MAATVSAHCQIAASPDAVWRMVADVTRMGEWSDENTGAVWSKGATGRRFKGTNRHGRHRWSTQCTVTTSEPGAAFAFDVSSAGLPVATWGYEFAPNDGGCTVTETWTDRRWPPVRVLGRALTGRAHAAEDNLVSMRATLANLKRVAEG